MELSEEQDAPSRQTSESQPYVPSPSHNRRRSSAAEQYQALVQRSKTVESLQQTFEDCASQASTSPAARARYRRAVRGGGALVDLLRRNSVSVGSISPRKSRADKNAIKDALLLPTTVAELVEKNNLGMADRIDASLAANHELLLDGIMEDLTSFWKGCGDPQWQVRSDMFRRRAMDVKKWHNETSCLSAEVNRWLFQYKIVHCHPPDSETATEKHERTQQLWSQLHEGGRKVELAALAAPFKDDLRNRLFNDDNREESRSMRPQSAGAIGASGGNAGRRPASAGCLSKSGSRRPSSAALDLDWKCRSSRSNVSAGSWDWARGSKGLRQYVAPSQIGSRATDHWAKSLFDLSEDKLREHAEAAEDREEMLREGSETFLTKAPRSAANASNEHNLSNSMKNRNSTSRSLPHLKRLSGTTTALQNHVLLAKQPKPERLSNKMRPASATGKVDRGRPPLISTFSMPWQSKTPEPTLKCEDTPAKQYLRACRKDSTVPRPLPFITGHSLKLKAGNQVLSDKDLLDLTVVLGEFSLTDIDLEGNTALTEKSLLKLVQVLSKPPASTALLTLSLKRCLQASKHCVFSGFIDAIGDPMGVRNLRELDLTDVVMGMRCHLPFASVIRDHTSLKSLNLCNTGLGITQGHEAKQFIYDLLGSQSIEILDLGWNCFDAEFFTHLGQRHVEMQMLRRLTLSNCTSSPKAGFSSTIVFFLEHLTRDFKLQFLDISLNHMDFRGALVAEDALMNCKKLTELNVSHNPLGVVGTRSLLRLLCRDSCGLMHFRCRDCFSGKSYLPDEGFQMFRCTNPGGRYHLNLQKHYHRALLRMLYKTGERFGLYPTDAFSNIVYSLGSWVHPANDSHGVWAVPNEGHLSVTFSVDSGIRNKAQDIYDYDFEGYLDRHFTLMRCAPSFRKVVPLFAQWRSSDSVIQEQSAMLDALSNDFRLTYPFMKYLCRNEELTGEIIQRLLGAVEGGVGARYLTLGLNRELVAYVRTLSRVKCLVKFNPQNPNGHYKLNMERHVEKALAERLLLLDRWESGVSLKLGHLDISQRGNNSVIRNEEFQHRPIDVRAMSEWHIPSYDILELDYTSNRRPPVKASCLDDATLSRIMVTLSQSECSTVFAKEALRMASHAMFITSTQLRTLFGAFKSEESYIELVVIFVTQVVDMQNEKIFRVRIENEAALAELSRRLGYIAMFPFIQPEQTRFVFNLAERDQRIATTLLLNLAVSESVDTARCNPEYIRSNGERDPLPTGVPRSWGDLNKIERGGQLSISYLCAPENVNFQKRKFLFETQGHWKLTVEEKDVQWWSSLKDAPEDVLTYLDFLTTQFAERRHPIRDAFAEIDGPGGNGNISLREFEAYTMTKCKKFKGAREKERIEAVFRFLDPSGEGQVSADEFMILDQMFKEIKLSIIEFVEFCERTFGEDLADSWVELTRQDDGRDKEELRRDEWKAACDRIGYCGPVFPIFKFVDKDDEGTISEDEFLELEKVKEGIAMGHARTLHSSVVH